MIEKTDRITDRKRKNKNRIRNWSGIYAKKNILLEVASTTQKTT